MSNQWFVVPVTCKRGTEYYIKNKSNGELMRCRDGSETFRTPNRDLADKCCQQANRAGN